MHVFIKHSPQLLYEFLQYHDQKYICSLPLNPLSYLPMIHQDEFALLKFNHSYS